MSEGRALRHDTTPSESQRLWREARRYLNQHRYDLTRTSKRLHAELPQVRPAGLLVRQDWLAADPVPLDRITLDLRPDAQPAQIAGSEPESSLVRPLRSDGSRFPTYAEALATLDRPALFEDRTSYRLLQVEQTADGTPRLHFGLGTYLDVINVSEAVAHELALASMRQSGTVTRDKLPFRSLIGDPCSPVRRRLMPALSVLTLRSERSGGARFVLHWRDPQKVAHAGGLYQVMPVGMFQPSHDAKWNILNDFDLWKSMVREYSEEFLGATEQYGSAVAPIDYEQWPFFRTLTAARRSGTVRVYWLGLGVDPLSFATDMLFAAVFDHKVFDDIFGRLVEVNEEGQVIDRADSSASFGIPFTENSVRRFAEREPMQPAGSALLQLSWEHRTALLS